MKKDLKIDIEKIKDIAKDAGKKIMEIYKKDIIVREKEDNSPLTKADMLSNKLINTRLKKLYPDIPIISEENKEIHFDERKNWKYFWLVDPLDGTKEFIKKNGEFTINIALIFQNRPIMGVIYAPVLNLLYYGVIGKGAFREKDGGNPEKLPIQEESNTFIKVVVSKSHFNEETKDFINKLKSETKKEIEFVHIGSSLKFCLIAEGRAYIYPRLGPTMEWDTAAGQAIVEIAGASVVEYDTGKPLRYNKKSLLNPFFVVKRI